MGAWIAELAADRFLMHYRVVSQHHEAAVGDGRIVSYDDQARSSPCIPKPLPPASGNGVVRPWSKRLENETAHEKQATAQFSTIRAHI